VTSPLHGLRAADRTTGVRPGLIRMPNAKTAAAAIARHALMSRPLANECVRSTITPVMTGAAEPPRYPPNVSTLPIVATSRLGTITPTMTQVPTFAK